MITALGKIKKGFTLIEIMIALTLFSLIMILMRQSLSQGISFVANVRTDMNRVQSADRVLEKICEELEQTVYFSGNQDYLFKAEATYDEDIRQSVITFASAAGARYDGPARLNYRSVYDPDNETYILYYSRQPVNETDGNPLNWYVLLDNISEFQILFFRDGDRVENWNSNDHCIPRLIEIKLTRKGRDDRSWEFERFVSPVIDVCEQ